MACLTLNLFHWSVIIKYNNALSWLDVAKQKTDCGCESFFVQDSIRTENWSDRALSWVSRALRSQSRKRAFFLVTFDRSFFFRDHRHPEEPRPNEAPILRSPYSRQPFCRHSSACRKRSAAVEPGGCLPSPPLVLWYVRLCRSARCRFRSLCRSESEPEWKEERSVGVNKEIIWSIGLIQSFAYFDFDQHFGWTVWVPCAFLVYERTVGKEIDFRINRSFVWIKASNSHLSDKIVCVWVSEGGWVRRQSKDQKWPKNEWQWNRGQCNDLTYQEFKDEIEWFY